MILNTLANIGIFSIVFVCSFLLHELMHIKSQGIKTEGTIRVHYPHSMTVGAKTRPYPEWFGYGGGILTAFIMFICVFLSDGFWQWSFLTLGWVQLCYGIYEGAVGIKYRYYIYGTIIVIMLLIWILLHM